jgi:CheY-like chemotaxis protein
MDIQMPVIDGHDAAKRIRAHESDWAKQIPIIAMTGDDRKEDIDRCFDSGMDDHLAKPIDMTALQQKVFDYIMNAE